MARARKIIRRSLAVFVLAFAIVAALAIVPAPAHASSCTGVLVSLDGCVAGVSLTPAPATRCAPAGTACATTTPPTTDQTPAIVPAITMPKHRAAPAKPHRAAPRAATPPAPVYRFRQADLDPSFTSGSFETTLPYDLPWFARRFAGSQPNVAAPPVRRTPDVMGLLQPLRIVLIYIGLGLLAAAVGVRKILVAH